MNFENMNDQQILEFLANANSKTEKWSNFIFGKKSSKFLHIIWKNPEEIKNMIPLSEVSNWEKDYEIIKEISKIENFMFEKYKKFITFAVKDITKKVKSYYMHCDFVNEAYIVFKKCLWFYSDTKFKFSTYLYKAILSMIHHIIFRKKNCKLNIDYKSEFVDCNISYATNDTEFLDDKNFDLEKIIHSSRLDEKESALLKLRFQLGKKWISEAKKSILKKDGSSYSKFGLRIILNRAFDKIKNNYFDSKISLAS